MRLVQTSFRLYLKLGNSVRRLLGAMVPRYILGVIDDPPPIAVTKIGNSLFPSDPGGPKAIVSILCQK